MRQSNRPAWNLQDAKAKLSELVDLAQSGKAQVILRTGKPAAAVVSIAEYETMHPRKSLVSFLLRSPLMYSELDLSHADDRYGPRSNVLRDKAR